jgi:ABC-2 type transport system permease protein
MTARHAGMSAHDPSPARSRPWVLVTAREIVVKLRDRNFLASTGLSLAIVVGVMLMQFFFTGGAPTYRVAVTDDAGTQLVAALEAQLQAQDPEAEAAVVRVGGAADGERMVRDGEADALLVREDGAWALATDGPAPRDLHLGMLELVAANGLAENAERLGVGVEELLSGTQLLTRDLSGDDDQGMVAYFAGLVFAMLFYVSSLLFGMSIATSVVEEKQSRIVEILAAAIPVTHLLLGKVLGSTVLALLQLALLAGVGLIGLQFMDLDLGLPGLAEAVAWYVPFFLFGFLALACIWAAAGALASRSEDVQSTSMPLTMVLVGVFVVGINLNGQAQVIGSFVPVMSTILMPMRLLADEAAWWEPLLALLLTLAFCAVTIAVGARLYRRSLLHTRGRLSWRKAWTTGD